MKQASAAEMIIGSGDEVKAGSHITYVNTISERDALKSEGFVFVRNAYLGDKTVHRGWAVYVWGKLTSSDPLHWIKTMEEESVDGLWSVRAEILETMVTKSELAKLIEKYVPIHTDDDGNYIFDSKTYATQGMSVSKELVFGIKSDDPTVQTPTNYGIRKGWYFRAIDTSNFNFDTNLGTIDFYLSAIQPTCDGARENGISSAFDPTFVSGFKAGRMVYIRNGSHYADCGEILAVIGNKITLGNIVSCPVAKTTTTYVSPFFNYNLASYKHYDKDGKLLPPGCPQCGNPDEWSISMTRSADGIVSSTVDTGNVGGNELTECGLAWGWDVGALGMYSTVLGINSVCYGKYASTIGTGIYNPIYQGLIVGRYNEIPKMLTHNPYIFGVGIGSSRTDRRDGLRIYDDGTVWCKKVSDVTPILPTEKKTKTISSKLNSIMRALGSGMFKTLNGIPFVSGNKANVSTTKTNQIGKIVTGITSEGEEVAVTISSSIAGKSEILWSVDAVNFYKSSLTSVGKLSSIVYSGKYKKFFAAGDPGIYWSLDGRIWTRTYTKPAAELAITTIGDDEIITSGYLVTRDGLNWSYGKDNESGDPAGAAIDVEGTIVCCASSFGSIMFSKNFGSTWESATLPVSIAANHYNSFSSGKTKSGKSVIFATAKDEEYPVLFTTDGEVWKKANLPEDKIYGQPSVIDNGIIVIPQKDNGLIISKEFEDDISEWKNTSIDSGSFTGVTEINLNSNKYFVCCAANENLIAVSKNKLNWALVGLDISAVVPNVFNGVVLFSDCSSERGIYTYSVSEMIEYFDSAIEDQSVYGYIEPIGDEWTEEDLVSKINEIIEALNSIGHYSIKPIVDEWTEETLVAKINEIIRAVNHQSR